MSSVRTCLEEIAKKCDTRQLKGIGITNQRETTVLWDKETGNPLYQSIVWSDGRIEGVVKRMIEATPSKSKDYLRVRNTFPLQSLKVKLTLACATVMVLVYFVYLCVCLHVSFHTSCYIPHL